MKINEKEDEVGPFKKKLNSASLGNTGPNTIKIMFIVKTTPR